MNAQSVEQLAATHGSVHENSMSVLFGESREMVGKDYFGEGRNIEFKTEIPDWHEKFLTI